MKTPGWPFLILFSLSAFAQELCEPVEMPEPLESLQRDFYEIVNSPKYPRNPNATICKRPVEMIDTIVIHHTGGGEHSAAAIGAQHSHRITTSKDPWYMVGYSYLINPSDAKRAQISDGRPLDIVGAHAGEEAYVPMSSAQKKLWDAGEVKCSVKGGPYEKNDEYLLRGDKIKANVTTIGMVVMGDFADYKLKLGKVHKADKVTPEIIDTAARMACQLQFEYPSIRYLSVHGSYKSTLCPGNLGKHLNEIIARAREYGCVFR